MFFFFSKPPVFKVNIHNLSQFVNHTVTLVQNKNNNERNIFEMRVMRLVFEEKTYFFQAMFILEKTFSQDLVFLFSFFFFLKFF